MKKAIFSALKSIGSSILSGARGGSGGSDGDARESTKGFEKARSFFASPYNLNISIGSVKFSSDTLDMIKFYMEEDYINNDYPIRVMTIATTEDRYIKMMQSAERVNIGGLDGLFKVRISSSFKMKVKGINNEPILEGVYRGMLIETESNMKYEDTYKKKTRDEFLIKGKYKTFSMYIFAEQELTFNTKKPTNNHIVNNATLMETFGYLFNEFNPDMQYVVSPFDHNPKMGLLPPMSQLGFIDFLKFLEAEVGFYRTDFFYYIYRGLFCFMNLSNNHNIIVSDYNNTFTVYPLRNDFEQAGYKIVQVSKRSYGVTIPSSKIKIWVDNKMSFKPTKVYVNADSSIDKNQQNISRKSQTVRKLTNIPHIKKESNVRYEFIEFTIDGFVDNKFSPFTVIIYLDSNNERREYRLIHTNMEITSGEVSFTYLKGYRILDREDDL